MIRSEAAEPSIDIVHEGWATRLVALPERLPGHPLLWAVVVFALLLVVPTVLIWAIGAQPVGHVDDRVWLPALIAGFVVGFLGVIDGIALRAFDSFRPALGDRPDVDRLRMTLVAMPDGPTLGFVALVLGAVSIGYFSYSEELSHFQSLPPIEAALILVANWIAIALTAVLIMHTVCQLVAVDRLHRAATNIDLFNPGPAHAFARLTAVTGIATLVAAAFIVGDPEAGLRTTFYIGLALADLLFAVAVFVLPLRGMNVRLNAEKVRLLGEVNERIKTVTARIHAQVDSDDLARAEELQSTLTSLVTERDLVSRLSTWPWSTVTVRGFASALLLPVLLWLITRALERVV